MISNHTGDSICTICGKVFAQAGETVTLAENLTIAELVIPAEVTLDLNGYNIVALFPTGYPAETAHPSRLHTTRKDSEVLVEVL